jgi:hypothetical protein
MIAFHGTPIENVRTILREGLVAERSALGCKHVCLARYPWVAANFGFILMVELHGLEWSLDRGEYRVHGDIEPWRIRKYPSVQEPAWHGWEDPALRKNHRACLQLYDKETE